jgi:hypothetical protein
LRELGGDRAALNWISPGRFQTMTGVIAESGYERFASIDMVLDNQVVRVPVKIKHIQMNPHTGVPEVLVRFETGAERLLSPEEAASARSSSTSFKGFTQSDGQAPGDDQVSVNSHPWGDIRDRNVVTSVPLKDAVLVSDPRGRPIWVKRAYARQAGIGPEGVWTLKTRDEFISELQADAAAQARARASQPPRSTAPPPESPQLVEVMDMWDVNGRRRWVDESETVEIELVPGRKLRIAKAQAEEVWVDGRRQWKVKAKPGVGTGASDRVVQVMDPWGIVDAPPQWVKESETVEVMVGPVRMRVHKSRAEQVTVNGKPEWRIKRDPNAKPEPKVAAAPPQPPPPPPKPKPFPKSKPEFARIISFDDWSAKNRSGDRQAWARSVLGVDASMDAGTVKKAYRKLAFDVHPDRDPEDSLAGPRSSVVNQAFDVLK